jgi:hypothetical protein
MLCLLAAITPFGSSAQQKIELPARDKVLPEKPTTVFSIGQEDGRDWELLSGVRQVAFDTRDNLYVLDGNNYRVLVFDANGKFVRKISKQGEGPGELMAPVGMAITADGSIVVGDIGRRAFSIFKPDGTFLKNLMFEEGEAPGLGGPGGSGMQSHPRAGFVVRAQPFLLGARLGGPGGASPQQLGAPTGERKSPIKHWDLATGKTKQLYELTLPSITPKVQDSGSGQGGERRTVMVAMAPVWGAPIAYGVLPTGGFALLHEKDYRVKVVSPNGQVERIIERAIAPKKATESDKKKFMETRQEAQRNGTLGGGIQMRVENGRTSVSTGAPARGAEAQSIAQMLENATFEDYIPVLRRVDADILGRIWISRTPADFGPRAPVDLIRMDGTYIGTLQGQAVPDAVSRSGRAAYIERDELGVEHVVVRNLPATWK